MAIFAPRRNEPIVGPGGYPTIRFSEYIQSVETEITQNNTSSNESVAELEAKHDRELRQSRLLMFWLLD